MQNMELCVAETPIPKGWCVPREGLWGPQNRETLIAGGGSVPKMAPTSSPGAG